MITTGVAITTGIGVSNWLCDCADHRCHSRYGMLSVERLAQHRGLVRLLFAWAIVMLICSLALYAAENGINGAIDDPLDAVWWGVTTLTTVGYGDVVPVTPEGRLAATVLMVLGIGLFAAITAIVTSFFLDTGSGSERPSAETRLREAQRLHAAGLIDETGARRGAGTDPRRALGGGTAEDYDRAHSRKGRR